MKKKYCKRILSAIMAASIVFSQIPSEQVFAAEVSGVEQKVQKDEQAPEQSGESITGTSKVDNADAGKSEDIDDVNKNSDAEQVDQPESDEKITDNQQDVQAPQKDAQEGTNSAEGNAPKQDTGVTEETQKDQNSLLEYALIEKPYVTTPDVQNILVGVGTENTVLDSAVLHYKNIETGEELEVPAAGLAGNAVLFTINYDSWEESVYKVTGMTYVIEGKEYIINFSEAGMEMKYGVNKEIETIPDDVIVNEEDMPEVEANVVTTDEAGQVLSEQDIQKAIENSQSSIPAPMALNEALGATQKSGNLVVVLDPGHDSIHSGTQASGYKEEELVLKIAQYCKVELEKYNGVTVYMTRDGMACPNGGDSVYCNSKRVEFAVSKNADVYISFHLNYAADSSVGGAEIYYPNSNYRPDLGTEGKELGQKILQNLGALGLKNRGVKIVNSKDNTKYPDESLADFYGVIRRSKEAGIPAIIIEHAFQSGTSDVNNFLNSDAKLQKLGVADARAIAEYYGLGIYNEEDYAAVYDYNYYINKYSDIKSAFGKNRAGALKHFVENGMAEGRQAKADFNVFTYKNRYVDLRNAYGNDLKSYYLHYIQSGQREGRSGAGTSGLVGRVTKLNGVDYSAVFDYNYYLSKYNDVKNVYGGNDIAVLQHFVNYGMQEGRQAKANFQVQSYYNKYADLRHIYGNNLKSYYLHYIKSGQREGRIATGVSSIQNCATVYNGVDYSAVYDYTYYVGKYSDVKNKYGLNDANVLKHFVENGIKEGRQAKADFNVTTYQRRYVDLRNAYGTDIRSYYLHYIQSGKREGRSGAGTSGLIGGVTKLNGIDYSAVYDYNYYLSKYSDIEKSFEGKDIEALQHFIKYGMQEGRQAKSNFQVQSYYNKYADLRRVYGNDVESYYLHYMRSGQKEGRIATGVASIQNCATVYNGVDYSAVYDYTYYVNKYSDIKKKYGMKDTEVLQHFVNNGMKEGRQAKADFNVSYYRNNYNDLSEAFGSNLPQYYLHYISSGKREGRIANRQVYMNIMGSSQTNVQQMMRYYNTAKVSYPSYYSENPTNDPRNDAPNLQTFCQIYIEECQAEGVRAEVAFAQAMKETSFLQYTGDVKIGQHNFGGLGATGDGEPGNSFTSVRIGIRAQIQHLKAYASKDELNNPCVDIRFNGVKRGSAPYAEWLGIQENPNTQWGTKKDGSWGIIKGVGWGAAKNYGYQLKSQVTGLLTY